MRPRDRLYQTFGYSQSSYWLETSPQVPDHQPVILVSSLPYIDSAIHSEMRSFASSLTEGTLLSQHSIQSLLKKEEEHNNNSWKQFLSLLANESIVNGSVDALVLSLVLREKFSSASAEQLVSTLTEEGKTQSVLSDVLTNFLFRTCVSTRLL